MTTTPTTQDRMSQMAALGADWWNDSCAPAEVAEAVALGASGGTSNPVIVYSAIKDNPDIWVPQLDKLVQDNPRDTEDDIAWKLIHEVGRQAAKEMMPAYERSNGVKGYLSMQVNPKYYPNPDLMVEQAVQLSSLAPNIAIKAPATAAGLIAMEEMTARGIRVNATVSFSVPQAIAISEIFESGLKKAKANGIDADSIKPYITIMIGRVDDQLNRVAEAEGIETSEGLIAWSGIAVFKNAYKIFKERGGPGTLLAAAYRHQAHWSEIIGSGVLQTIPYGWWTKFNVSDHEPVETLENPVDDAIIAELKAKFPDFNKAYEPDGMKPEEFIRYGASLHTLNQFLGGYAQLLELVRSRMLNF